MTATRIAAIGFAREHLRTRLVLVLLVAIPAGFVTVSATVLSDFADALGGSLAGRSATALAAGWAAAFVSGALGFFQVSSSRGADRRLAIAGLGAGRVATARIAAAALLAGVTSVASLAALLARQPVPHPGHAVAAIGLFAVTYLGIGAIVGCLVTDPLEGSLLVAVVFLLDAFSAPAMTGAGGLIGELAPTRWAAEVLVAAGAGTGSARGDWRGALLAAAAALLVAVVVFRRSARTRS